MSAEIPSAGPPQTVEPASQPALADVLKRMESLAEEHAYICQILEEIYGVLGEILGHVERDESRPKPADPQRRLWPAEPDDSAPGEQPAPDEGALPES